MEHLGFIGFGEAPYNFTRDLDRAIVKVFAYDVAAKGQDLRGETIRKNAAENEVTLVESIEDLTECCNIVFCFTSANSALPIACQIAPLMRQGTVYVDLNSTSPATKEEIGKTFANSNADFVEAAVMASVPANRTKVPIYVCGKRGRALADMLNPAGTNIHFLGEKLGAASATKMLKSVLFKGFIALLTETVFATDHYGITEEVLGALKHMMLEEMTYEQCCNYFVEAAAKDSVRMSQEMGQVVETLESMGENSIMAQAAKRKLEWLTEQGYCKHFVTRPHGYAEVLSYKRELDSGETSRIKTIADKM